MPKDISSSSSEDEADSPAPESAPKQKEAEKKTTRYQCPADYVSFSHVPCSSTLTDKLKKSKNELWLIKAPAGFNPECFSRIKVPLSGLHSLKVPSSTTGAASGGGQQVYSILASNHCTSDIRLLTSDKQSSDSVVFAPTFSGMLNVCESYGDSSTNQAPQIIPAAPAPSIPLGLKQRFHPFGSKTPTVTRVAENETDGSEFGPSSTTARAQVGKRFLVEVGRDDEQEEEEGRKKKKKKKKEKRIKVEEMVEVKEEPGAEVQEEGVMEVDHSEEKRKKKKKKKDREREQVEEGLEASVEVKVEEVTVKPEPIDTSYSDAAEGTGKKKKKKKKSKTGDD